MTNTSLKFSYFWILKEKLVHLSLLANVLMVTKVLILCLGTTFDNPKSYEVFFVRGKYCFVFDWNILYQEVFDMLTLFEVNYYIKYSINEGKYYIGYLNKTCMH